MKKPESMTQEAEASTESEIDPGAEHGIADARFLALLEVYELETTTKVDRPHGNAVAALAEKLDAALALEEKDAVAKGELERVTAVMAEREALKNDEYPPEQPTERGRLLRLRGIWESESAKLTMERDRNLAELQPPFFAQLDELIATLTKERKIDEALRVKRFRDGK